MHDLSTSASSLSFFASRWQSAPCLIASVKQMLTELKPCGAFCSFCPSPGFFILGHHLATSVLCYSCSRLSSNIPALASVSTLAPVRPRGRRMWTSVAVLRTRLNFRPQPTRHPADSGLVLIRAQQVRAQAEVKNRGQTQTGNRNPHSLSMGSVVLQLWRSFSAVDCYLMTIIFFDTLEDSVFCHFLRSCKSSVKLSGQQKSGSNRRS
jgi:hypothetical protein